MDWITYDARFPIHTSDTILSDLADCTRSSLRETMTSRGDYGVRPRCCDFTRLVL